MTIYMTTNICKLQLNFIIKKVNHVTVDSYRCTDKNWTNNVYKPGTEPPVRTNSRTPASDGTKR